MDNPPFLIVEGITLAGKKFRPNDWAERISGVLASFENHRIHYSSLLYPIYHEEKRCLVVDRQLETLNPALYASILEFATINQLHYHYASDSQA